MVLKWLQKKKLTSFLWVPIFWLVLLHQSPLFGRQNGQIGCSLLTGYAQSIVEEAIDGVEGAQYDPFCVAGLELEYVLPFDLSVGMAVTYAQIDISVDYPRFSSDYGSVTMVPVMITAKHVSPPFFNLVSYVELAAGINCVSFEPGPFFTQYEEETGLMYEFDLDNNSVINLGLGIRKSLGNNWSVSLGPYISCAHVNYAIQAQTANYSAEYESGIFELSSFQLVLKLSYWQQLRKNFKDPDKTGMGR